MPSIDPSPAQSIQWGSETLARCFSLRGVEQGYGIEVGDVGGVGSVTLDSQLLAYQLWSRAEVSHKQTPLGFGVAMNFDRLVFDMCAHHRRNIAGVDRN